MPRKQLFALFICNLMVYIVGNSLMSLLPIYIGDELGAGSIAAGAAISIAFAVLAVSTSISANVARRFGRRTSIIRAAAFICVPAVWLMGQTQHVVVFTVLFAVVWFFAGMLLTTTQILTALHARPDQRGRTLGVLVAAGSLAQLIGGFTAGRIVSSWGYEALFLSCAVLYAVPIFASWLIEDRHPPQPQTINRAQSRPAAGNELLLLLGASIFAHIASFVINMARPLVMDALDFETAAITSVVAVSGLITLPLPVLAGWLADRFGRKPVLAGAYVLTVAGAVLYSVAGSLPIFWIAQALASVLTCTMVVGTALVTDIVPRENADVGVARFATTPWIGAVVGSTAAGLTMQYFGAALTFEIAAGLILVAVVLALSLRTHRQAASTPASAV